MIRALVVGLILAGSAISPDLVVPAHAQFSINLENKDRKNTSWVWDEPDKKIIVRYLSKEDPQEDSETFDFVATGKGTLALHFSLHNEKGEVLSVSEFWIKIQ